MTEPPPDFAPHFRQSPATAPWEPLFSAVGETVRIGFHVREAHCNSRGLLHGGVIAALADNAMGLSLVAAMGGQGGVVTTALALDYLASAKSGQWIEIAPRVVKAGKSSGVVDALVTADGALIARANASFRTPT